MSLIGQTIKWHRMRQGMTQEQLAAKICSSAYLSKLENNQLSFNKEIISQLCKRLDLPVDQFIAAPDEELFSLIEQWLEALHHFDLHQAEKYYQQVKPQVSGGLAIEMSYLYELALFGHYLLSQQHAKADEKLAGLTSVAWIIEEHYPYSYHKFMGYYYLMKFYCSNAIDHFKKAEKVLKDTVDPELYLMMANAYSRTEKILRSNKYAQKAFQLFQAELDYTRIISCQIILGLNYCLIDDFETAEEYFNKLRSLDESHVGVLIKSVITLTDGILHFKREDYDQAESYLKQALAYDTNHQVKLGAHHYLSVIYVYKGQKEKASTQINEGLKVADLFRNQRYRTKLKTLEYFVEDRNDELLDYLLKEVIPFYQDLNEETELTNYYLLTGSLMYEMKRYKGATEKLLKAYAVERTESVLIPNSTSAKRHPSSPFETQ